MSQEITISSSDVLSLIQTKTVAAVDYIWNVNKQLPEAEAIYKCISRIEASNVNKTNIVNSINELAKHNVVVNKKTNSGFDSFFPYNDNLNPLIPEMKLASLQQRQ